MQNSIVLLLHNMTVLCLFVEMVPTGGMPRHVRVVVDRALVDRVSPGNRVCVVGVPSLQVS